jgi:multiple sugar transport system substrate-binding protein
MIKKRSASLLTMLLIILMISGCATNQATNSTSSETPNPAVNDAKPAAQTPVELLVYGNVNHNASDFDNFFLAPIKKKYPYISMKLIMKDDVKPEELLASGTTPDIIYDSPPGLVNLQDLDMIMELDDYVKKFNVDISQYEPTAIDMVRLYHPSGKLLAIPLYLNFSALFYNKDLFNKFAVPFPKDGMSWDEAIDLARKVTRTSDGVDYRGLDPGVLITVSGQLTLSLANAKTGKAELNTDGWKKAFQFMENLYGIPGNRPDIKQRTNVGVRDSFFKSQNLAMMADWGINSVGQLGELYDKGVIMNWDMASLPYFKDKPGISRKVDAHLLMLSKSSKHKDDAFQVIKELTSKEVETMAAEEGQLPSLTDPAILRNYGKNLPVLKGKNMNVILNYKSAKQFVPTLFDPPTQTAVNTAYNQVYTGQKDINTALREAEEAANKAIAEMKSK